MRAEIISIGTELLLGHTVNSDAAILGRELASLGIDLHFMQTVGDNASRLAEALQLAVSRSDIVITSGGLGPTDDDLTKQAIASFAGVELREDEASMRRLREYFGARPMSANQRRQVFMPAGAEIFPNDVGTAPGCAVKLPENKQIIMLPGPPHELSTMFSGYVRPYLASLSQNIFYSDIVRTFGIGEGMAAEKLGDMLNQANPTIAPYAHGGEMFFRVTAKAGNEEQGKEMCGKCVERIREILGNVVYGINVASLADVTVTELIGRGLTLATAESCTGGLLSKKITDIPGASAIFHLGMTTYANEAKEKILGVPEDLLKEYGAVSPQTAKSMAENIKRLAASDLGIGITGIAGPDGGTPEKPVGLVYIALACDNNCYIREMKREGRYLGREWTRERAVSHALDMTRRFLTGLPVETI